MPFAPGDTLFEYRITRALGQGTFGTVYLAQDTLLDRPVAIKELTPAAQAEPVAFQRFLQEARAAGNLNHPHIVTVYALKPIGDAMYMVMEYLAGGSLRGVLSERGRLPVDDAVRIATDVCDGLAAAHAKGIVHRDIKPENILLTADGRAKVGDFGIAHVPRTAGGAYVGGLTQTGFQPGTLIYMSPEQICGEAVDGRSDVYQVGALLYEMLAGRHYIDMEALTRRAQETAGGNVLRMQARLYALLEQAICNQQTSDVRTVRSDVPGWLGATVTAMLTRSLAYRPAARQLGDELRHKKNEALLEQGSPSRQSTVSVPCQSTDRKQPEQPAGAEPNQPAAIPVTKVFSPAIPLKNEPPVVTPPTRVEPFWRRWLRGSSGQQPRVTGAQSPPRPRIVSGQAWRLPDVSEILEVGGELSFDETEIRWRMQTIEDMLAEFGVPASIVEVNQGPAVTQFGLRPGTIVRRDRKGEEKVIKVRVSQIQALANDLSLALAASPIRIEAPAPGRDFVGVEVPNTQISMVSLRGVMDCEEWAATKGDLVFGLGRDVSGQATVADLVSMPHLLIAGATGSGKSVCVNAIITSLLLTHTPDTLRFLMIDPRRVELTIYNGIPHLIAPVVVDVERALPVLQWAEREMERRYKEFSKLNAPNIESYNEKLAGRGEPVLPYIVILVDELADLTFSAPEDVERCICRIAQMARATGIHLVLTTQRPSADVITGAIKASFPARIAFRVASQIDSRVILDAPGAEKLLSCGDMLFMSPDSSKPARVQGCFVSEHEIHRLVQYWRGDYAIGEPEKLPIADQNRANAARLADRESSTNPAVHGPKEFESTSSPGGGTLQVSLWDEIAAAVAAAEAEDELYRQAVEEIRKSGKASISLLQRKLRIGYSRAARMIDQMEAAGVIGPYEGGSSRRVLKYSEDR